MQTKTIPVKKVISGKRRRIGSADVEVFDSVEEAISKFTESGVLQRLNAFIQDEEIKKERNRLTAAPTKADIKERVAQMMTDSQVAQEMHTAATSGQFAEFLAELEKRAFEALKSEKFVFPADDEDDDSSDEDDDSED